LSRSSGKRRRTILAWAGAALLFLLSFGGALFLTLPRETLLLLARTTASRAGFAVDARSASTRFPATVRFDNVTLLRRGSPHPFLADRVELGIHPVGIFFGAPLRVRLLRSGGTVDSGSTLSFTRGKVSVSSLSSADLSIPPSSGFSFRVDTGDATWSRRGRTPDGSGTLRFRELRFPVPGADSPVREVLLKNVTIRFSLSGDSLRITSLAGEYEDTRMEGTGEITSLFGAGEPAVSGRLRVLNPLSGRVAALFDMTGRNARNATFHLSGPLRSPRGELQLF
jgi:type II secretion system protein N